MRSERVKGADEGESDPGWDRGRLASHANGDRTAHNIGDFLVAPAATKKTEAVMRGG